MSKILSCLCVAIWMLPIGNILAADDALLPLTGDVPDDVYWDNSISPP